MASRHAHGMTPEEFLADDPVARSVFEAVSALIHGIGPADMRVGKSQIGFYRARPFAALWRPGQYLAGDRPPLVLTVFLSRRDPSPRWKEVAQPRPGRFSHHLELSGPSDFDTAVANWLAEAWAEAGA